MKIKLLDKFVGKTILGAVLAVFTFVLPVQSADFTGKTIEWIIPFSEGGGSDKWARFYAPLLAEKLPGKPNVIVRNVPGGGSTTGTNQFAQRAKPDGLTILGTSGSTQFPFLLGDKRVRYDYADWTAVLGTPTGGVVYVSPSTGVRSINDIKKLQSVNLIYASQGATSLDLVPLLAFDLMDFNVKAVFGFKGRGPGRLAFERGEVNIDYQTTSSYLKNVAPSMVKDGKAIPLFTWGSLDKRGRLMRDPTFPDLPHFGEVYKMIHGKNPSGVEFNAWKAFFAAGFPGQKMVFLPKGTSRDVIRTYRDAFSDVVASDVFKNTSGKTLGVYPQATGRAAESLKKTATQVDSKSKQWVKNWLSDKYKVKL